MLSGKQYVVVLLALALVSVSILVGLELFAPHRGATTEQELPPGAEPLADGTFQGEGERKVTGTVTLFRDDRGPGLYFEDYAQPSCPTTRLYLTPSPDPDTVADIQAGRRVHAEGDLPSQGTFVVRLGPNVTVGNVTGVAVWCASTDALLGSAPLQPVNESAERVTPTPSPTPATPTATANVTNESDASPTATGGGTPTPTT